MHLPHTKQVLQGFQNNVRHRLKAEIVDEKCSDLGGQRHVINTLQKQQIVREQ
jgi:hypothetical protein